MLFFKKNYKLLIISLIIIACIGSIYGHTLRAPKRGYSDFHCFYVAGKRILNQENIYVIKDKTAAEFRYAPIFAVLMSGLALMEEGKADTLWHIINLYLLVILFILMKKMVTLDKLDYRAGLLLYGLTFLGVMRFILNNLNTGQSNILMMSGIIIGLYYISKKNEVLGGSILAFSMTIKYTPLIFIPYFLLRRKIKLSLVILASLAVYLLLPSLFIGSKTNISYLKNMVSFLTNSTILEKTTILDPKNQSLLSLFHRLFSYRALLNHFHIPPMPFQSLKLSDASINLIFISAATVIYLIALYRPRKIYLSESAYNNIDYALLLICVALFNLNAWMHNYILLTPGYFVLAYYLIKIGFKDKLVLTLCLFSYLLNIMTIKSILGETLTYKIYFYSPFTISGMLVFLALLRIKFLKRQAKNAQTFEG